MERKIKNKPLGENTKNRARRPMYSTAVSRRTVVLNMDAEQKQSVSYTRIDLIRCHSRCCLVSCLSCPFPFHLSKLRWRIPVLVSIRLSIKRSRCNVAKISVINVVTRQKKKKSVQPRQNAKSYVKRMRSIDRFSHGNRQLASRHRRENFGNPPRVYRPFYWTRHSNS